MVACRWQRLTLYALSLCPVEQWLVEQASWRSSLQFGPLQQVLDEKSRILS